MKLRKLTNLICALNALISVSAYAGQSDRLPRLQRVGIIPVRYESGDWRDTEAGQKTISKAFHESVRESRRFRVINDDLVKQLWSTAAGRKELQSRHEMDAMVNMTAVKRGDTVDLTTRLLSPNLDIYLQESDTLGEDALKSNDKSEIEKTTRDLVFRMFNRLPADVFVTAVQGKYVTLAGGEQQGVKIGNEFEVQQSTVESFHPANGSWLTFKSKPVGTIKVIDSRNTSSVAEITDLVHDNAINPGDGIKVGDIKARSQFRKNVVTNPAMEPKKEGSVLVDPVPTNSAAIAKKGMQPAPAASTAPAPTPAPAVAAAPKASPESNPETAAEPTKDGDPEKPAASSAPDSPTAEAAADAEKPAEDEATAGPPVDVGGTVKEMTKNMAESYSIYAALKMWSVSGPGFSAAMKMPFWMFSNFGAEFHKNIFDDIKIRYGAGLLWGGNYFGYEFFGRPYYEMTLGSMPKVANTLRLGAFGKLEGKNVKDDSYGGSDALKIGPAAALAGVIGKDILPEKVNWQAGLDLPMFAFGRVGYNGSQHSVSGIGGWTLRGEAMLDQPIEGYKFGMGLDYGNETLKSSDSIKENLIKITVLANKKW